MTPIGKLVLDYIGPQTLRQLVLVHRLGYRNFIDGLHHLDVLVETGIAPAEMLTRLPTALEVDPSVVQAAWEETSEQLWNERVRARSGDQEHARRHFRPHVFVETERVTPEAERVYLAAVDGLRCLKHIPVNETVARLAVDWQHRYVRRLMRKHQTETGGWCGTFGRVVGYVYRPCFEQSIRFSAGGQLVRSGDQLSVARP